MKKETGLFGFASACALLCMLGGITEAATGYGLSPPFDVKSVRAKTGGRDTKAFACAASPAPMKDLHMESFYRKDDATSSAVDPQAYAVYKAATKPASVYEVGLESMANRYVRSNPPRPELAQCPLDWLATWAKGGALLGDVNKNGEYTRKWLLGSIASAWLQIRDEPSLDSRKKADVTNWIREVAGRVRDDFSRDTQLKSRQNNHLYWAAWSVAAAGMVTGDRGLFDWGMEKARFGINQIQADGTLPNELARGRRAYLYHLFSAMPLFMLANAADKNGIDLFQENNGALRRLGNVLLGDLGNPSYFREITREEQDMAHAGTRSDLGWVEIYRQHYDDPRADAALRAFRPMKQSRFGGNITLLYGQLAVKAPQKRDNKG
ncbi:MAG: alginate lyase family protein [Alphaproteobacteria bacterium]